MLFGKYMIHFKISDEDFKSFTLIIVLGLGLYSITNIIFNANQGVTQIALSAVILAIYVIQLLLLFFWVKCAERRKIIQLTICFLIAVMSVLAFEVLVAGDWVLEKSSKEIRLVSFISGVGIGILLWQTIKFIGYLWAKALVFTACIAEFMGRLIDSDQHILLYLIPFLLIISLAVFLLYTDQKVSGKEYSKFQTQRTLKKRWKDFVKCSMPLPLLIVDKNLGVRFYNDSFRTTFGLQCYKNTQSQSQILEILNSAYIDKNSLPMFTGITSSPRIRPSEDLRVDTHVTLIQNSDSRNNFTLKSLLSLDEVKNFTFQEGIKISHCKMCSSLSKETDFLEYELRLNSINWKNDGCFLLMFQDTSILQLNEKLKQINIYKDMLLATVSHDLRTPINGILNIIDIIEQDITEEHQSLLKICRDSGDLLLLMINDILDFSQIQNQKLKLSFTTAVTRKIVTEVVDLVSLQAEKKGIELKTEVEKDVPMQIYTDPVRLKQILLNLLTNALKFTKQGYIKVSARLNMFKNTKQIQFSVEDTGLGIKVEDQEKLFKMFGKIEQKNPDINKNGIGLGLKICQDLLEMLNPLENNKFEIDSTHGKGTTFKFYVTCESIRDSSRLMLDSVSSVSLRMLDSPLSATLAKRTALKGITLTGDRNQLRSFSIIDEDNAEPSLPVFRTRTKMLLDQVKPKVLVVDDTAYNVVALTSLLENLKVECYSAFDGEQAIKKLTEEKLACDLIFMDCNMPIMDGFTAASQLRKLMESNLVKTTPIIAVTGYSLPEEHQRCLDSGMNKVLVKPLKKALLKEILEEYGLIKDEAKQHLV